MAGKINGLSQYPFCNMRKSNIKTSGFDGFDKTYYSTDGYDDYLVRFEEEGREMVSRLVDVVIPDPHWRFLDVGCGMGGAIIALRNLGYSAWGTEVSPFCLKHSPVKKWMKLASVTDLPFKENDYDVVMCMDVICYLNQNDAIQACRELVRVTKNYLYIESVCKGSPNNSQSLNPDLLRKDKEILSGEAIRRMFENNDTLFVEELYSKKESPDFNGVFVK